MIYFADGCHRRAGKRPHPSVDRPGIPPGGVIASAVTPIAWPRPPGDPPAAPTEPWPGIELMPPGLFPRTD